MDLILSYKENLNKAFINKYTNIYYQDNKIGNQEDYNEDYDRNCHTTRDMLIKLLECVSCKKIIHENCNKNNHTIDISNFQTIYFEYKGIGHSFCIYKNQILQSFANYHYLKSTNLSMCVHDLCDSIEKNINLFFPEKLINLNNEINLYVKIKYYYTNISRDKIKKNLFNLLDIHE
jgi:hypothetical protein